jgi:NAD dependent epimerase/dehydratase family enzyme
MKVVIAGGSGQVGTVLARAFRREGDEVAILTRGADGVRWDGRSPGPWFAEIDGADVVINLAGRSVNCRYHAANRRAIMDSRVDSTRVVGEAIAAAQQPPRVWLQASTATIYAHRFDAPNDERTGRLGGDEPGAPDTWRFSIDVARTWERTFDEAETPATRKVAMRSAMVMSPGRGGIFDTLLTLVRRGLGGTAAGGASTSHGSTTTTSTPRCASSSHMRSSTGRSTSRLRSTRGGPRPHARWSPSTDAGAGRAADPRAAGSLESGT